MPLIYTRHDPRFYDRRLYKGGDGGAGQMRADEEDRQRKVQAAVDAINAKFNATEGFGIGFGPVVAGKGPNAPTGGPPRMAREKLYDDLSGAVKETAMRDVDKQYTKASRANTFGLARAGLLGGSVDAEAGGELQTTYGEGKLKAAQAGMSAASDLRATDEKTRQNLISLAQSGMDVGTASSLAAGQMGAAAEVAKNNANAASVGSLFDGMSQAYLTNQMLKARQPGTAAPGATTNYGAGAAVSAGKGYFGRAG